MFPEFTDEQLAADPILKYFRFDHLSEPLRSMSSTFYMQAFHIVSTCPRNPERTVAVRKLLEAKDAAVRAMLG